MKICQFTSSFLPNIGGAEYAIHYLAKNLSLFNQDVTVLSPSSSQNKSLTQYEIQKLWIFSPLRYLSLFLEWNYTVNLTFEKMRKKFDLIHSHFLYPCGYVSSNIKNFLKIPIICTPHGSDIQVFPEINYGIRLNPRINSKVLKSIKQIDAFISINPSITKELINCGADKQSIFEIPNGVDTQKFKIAPQINIKKKYQIEDSNKIILSVGRNHPKKGYIPFLKIIPEILKSYSQFVYIIVGRDTKSLIPLINKLHIQKNVLVFERLTSLELVNFYRSASIFLSPSLIEGLALVYLEALAAGLPIVATKISSVKNIVIDQVNGFTVSKDNYSNFIEPILFLLSDNKKLQFMGSNSQKMAYNFDWKKITESHLRVYRKLINS